MFFLRENCGEGTRDLVSGCGGGRVLGEEEDAEGSGGMDGKLPREVRPVRRPHPDSKRPVGEGGGL